MSQESRAWERQAVRSDRRGGVSWRSQRRPAAKRPGRYTAAATPRRAAAVAANSRELAATSTIADQRPIRNCNFRLITGESSVITRRGDLGPAEAGVFLQFSRLGPARRFGCKFCAHSSAGMRGSCRRLLAAAGRLTSGWAPSARPRLLADGNDPPRAALMAIGHHNWSVL